MLKNRGLRWLMPTVALSMVVSSFGSFAGADDTLPDPLPGATLAERITVANLVAESGVSLEEGLAMVRASGDGNDLVNEYKALLGGAYTGAFVDVENGVISIGSTDPALVAQLESSVDKGTITDVIAVGTEISAGTAATVSAAAAQMLLTSEVPSNLDSDPVTGSLLLEISDEATPADEVAVAVVEQVVEDLGGTIEVAAVPADELGDAGDAACINHKCDWPAAGARLRVKKNATSPFSYYDCTAGPIAQNINTGRWYMTTSGHCVQTTGGSGSVPLITGQANVPKDSTAEWQHTNNTYYTAGPSVQSSVNFYTSDFPIDYALYDITNNASGNQTLGLSTSWMETGNNTQSVPIGYYYSGTNYSSYGGAWMGALATWPAAGTIICNHGFQVYNTLGRQDCGYAGSSSASLRFGWGGYNYLRYWSGTNALDNNNKLNNVRTYMGDSGAPVTFTSGGVMRLAGIVSTGSTGSSSNTTGGWYSMGAIRATDMFGNLNSNTGFNLVYYYHPCAYGGCSAGS